MVVAIDNIMKKEVKRLEMWNANLGPKKGSIQSGERPVVVLGNDRGNKFSPVVIVAPVTSKVKKPMPTHVRVGADELELYEDSIILLEQITTISKDQLEFKIATLPDKFQQPIKKAISISLSM